MELSTFMSESQRNMEEAGVEIILKHEDTHVTLPDGLRCNGYFVDKPKRVFACATNKPFIDWFLIYLHEYCHFTQWDDGIPEWIGVTVDGLYYDDFLDRWLAGKVEFPQEKVSRFIDASIAVEADCERRAVALIEKLRFNYSIREYAQKANAYIHFYNYIKQNRKWYREGFEPYNIEAVWSQFNTTIDDEFPLVDEYLDLYEKHCF